MRKYSKKDNKYYNFFIYFPQCSNKNLGEICLTKQIVAFMKNFSLCFFFFHCMKGKQFCYYLITIIQHNNIFKKADAENLIETIRVHVHVNVQVNTQQHPDQQLFLQKLLPDPRQPIFLFSVPIF